MALASSKRPDARRQTRRAADENWGGSRVEEIRRGDPQRLKITGELGVLAFSEDVRSLIQTYNEKLGLAGKAKSDLLHFAYAAAYNNA